MTILMPVICLPLGLPGALAGMLIGLLLDNILIIYLMVIASKSFAMGRTDILRLIIDTKTVAEAALIVSVLPDAAESPRDLFLVQEWILEHARPFPLVPMAQHALRIAVGLFQIRHAIDRNVMTGVVYAASEISRKMDLLFMALRAGAATRSGTDIHNLRETRSIAVGLNIDEETFTALATGGYGLDLSACTVLGVSRNADHGQLVAALHKPTATKYSENQVQEAFACVEAQLDLIARYLGKR